MTITLEENYFTFYVQLVIYRRGIAGSSGSTIFVMQGIYINF